MSALRRRSLLSGSVLAAALPFAGLPFVAQAQPAMTKVVHGTLNAVAADRITVATRGGDTVAIGITDRTPVVVIAPASLAALKTGAYVGTAAVPAPNGGLRALEVHVFAEAMRGVGEGHGPWQGDNTTMTNATVGEIAGTDGRTLRLVYKGGEQTVTVTPETPIVTMDRGTQTLLVKGAHVSVTATVGEGGALQARFAAVGKDGYEPPL